HQVQQHQVGRALAGQAYTLAAQAAGDDVEALELQRVAQAAHQIRFVLDDQHAPPRDRGRGAGDGGSGAHLCGTPGPWAAGTGTPTPTPRGIGAVVAPGLGATGSSSWTP